MSSLIRRPALRLNRRGINLGFVIPVANLTLDLDSTLGVSGDPINSWTSQDASSRQFTAAGTNRPTVGSGGGPDGADVVRFDGTDDIMSGNGFDYGALISDAEWSSYAVVKVNNFSAANTVVLADDSNTIGLTRLAATATGGSRHWEVRNTDSGGLDTANTAVADPGAAHWGVVSTRHGGGTIYVDALGAGSSSAASADSTVATLAETPRLGGRTSSSQQLDGDLRRQLVYDVFHDSGLNAQIMRALAALYSVPV